MEKKEQLYEGKAKKVYATEDPNLVIVSYKDDATAFDGAKKGTIVGKGVINNQMTNRLMAKMEKAGIPTHFVEELSERDTLVKKVSIVPLEVIIRNISAGHFASRYGVEEGIVFSEPTIEFSYKNDDLHDPLMNAYHAVALKLATWEEIELIKKYAFAVNDTLKAFWSECGVTLVDFKLEFGKTVDGQIVLADEISPRHLPPVGQQDERKARQGPLPPRPRRRGRRLRRSHEAPDGSRRTVRSNMTENHNIIPARHIHEECGVFGIFTPQEADVASYAYYALYSLQHRGQESAGIVVNDDGLFRSLRDTGLVSEVFPPEQLKSLGKGTIAVGHVRYGTTGSDNKRNVQPILVNHFKGRMALAHNGNLTNSRELRQELESRGSIFQTTTDSEVIAYIIVQERLNRGSIEEAVPLRWTASRARIPSSSSPTKLIAARDPTASVPSAWGI